MKFPYSTPSADGEIFISPEFAELKGLISQLNSSAANPAMPDNTPIGPSDAGQLRSSMRDFFSKTTGLKIDAPIIATGHQCEFHHCGVWFKDAVTFAAANALGGQALHIAADLDTISETKIAIPKVENSSVTLHHVKFTNAANGFSPSTLPVPDTEAVDSIIQSVNKSNLNTDCFEAWLEGIKRTPKNSTLADWFDSGKAAANEFLGLNIPSVKFSQITGCKAFSGFATSIILDGFRFLEIHNAELAVHRKKYSISNNARPVPDLVKFDDETIELPLWVIRKNSPRAKLIASISANKIRLFADNEKISDYEADPDKLCQALGQLYAAGSIIAPRALTLTMFLRHFAVDIFVHGTGGARYDILGDEISSSFYGYKPDQYIAATATRRLDLPKYASDSFSLSQAKWQMHHWYHNPLSADSEPKPSEMAQLEKLLARIDSHRRKSSQRRDAFAELVLLKKQLRQQRNETHQKLIAQIERIESELVSNSFANSREYFFALFESEKLLQLADKAKAWTFGGGK